MDSKKLYNTMMFSLYFISNFFSFVSIGICVGQNMILDKDKQEQELIVLNYMELAFSYYFILEYFILLFIAKNKTYYIFSMDTILDIITIVPSIITYYMKELLVNSNFSILNYLRIFRIFRVFRYLRI